jgi:hypothetical protein
VAVLARRDGDGQVLVAKLLVLLKASNHINT